MMPIDADILLSVLLVGVYLVDSMHFLSIGDALVTTRGRRPRGLSFGSGFELGGRRLFLSNPFTPFWPEFRVEWDTAGAPVSAPSDVAQAYTQHLSAVRPIQPLVAISGFFILLVAPIALALGFSIVFLGAVAVAWVVSIAACAIIIARRAALGMTGGQTAGVVFVALICLPCGPNLIRAITRRREWRLNAQDLPLLGFPEATIASVRGQVRGALEHAQRFVAEEGKERQVIDAQLRALGEVS